MSIDLGREPDETTVCKFRHLLEEHGLGERSFERASEHLQAKGWRPEHGDDHGCNHHPLEGRRSFRVN